MTLLAEYLEKSGLTHEAFARASGVERSMVTHYANGTRNPGLDYALAIEAATRGKIPAAYWRNRKTTPSRKRKRTRAA